ncbi:MAG: HDOD domain-containing protein [Deltaproteobacteria bacterium]|nr:HDOD domain-containing protein [Deltaproteobacteria bacterium]
MEEIQLVHIGDCRVTGDPDTILETCLGSCVGVAIYDAVRHIGGMCHILLPDGPAEKKQTHPAAYATTAIPFLLNAFEELGGERKTATTAIAGGASIMTKNTGTDLKIGQRNLLAVMEGLRQADVKVSYQHVAGNLGRVMRLYMRNGQIHVRTSRMPTSEEAGRQIDEQWNANTLRTSILQNAEDLKPSSNVAIRALQLTNGEDTNISELEQLILQDQVLAANMLKEANSAYYGLSRQVHNLSQAVAYLGMRTFKKIVMDTCLADIYDRRITTYDMEEGAFFYHSVTCARISEAIAKVTGCTEPETAYLAGLLHDIGKIVIERYGMDMFTQVTSRVLLKNESFVQAEKDVFGLDHAAIGQYIAHNWQLPAELEEAIAFHHEPENMNTISPLPCIIHVADHICNIAGIGLSNDSMTNGLSQSAITALDLDERAIEDILATVPRIIHTHL